MSAILLATGCGESADRIRVTGTVTFRGEPVPVGTIYFEPAQSLGTEAPTGFAIIRQGKFVTMRERGCSPGIYMARINGYDGNPSPIEEELAAERIAGREDQQTIPVGTPLCEEVTREVTILSDGEPLQLQLAAGR